MTSNPGNTDPPAVSVVVSAYDRVALVPALVGSLRAQTLDDFEALLVDNGSTDNTYSELCRLTEDDDRFRVLRVADNAGPARARNLAWRSSEASLIAFTDDDCAPSPTWLEELVTAAANAEIVQGQTVPAERSASETPGWFDRTQRIARWSGRFETCNMAISRQTLEAHGGFDEQFPIAMGEDTDFGLRAVAAGARTAFASDAIVVHHRWPTGFRDYLHQRRRYAESVQLMKVNPGARTLLRWGFVLRGVHLLVWGLIPALPVSVWLGAPWLVPAAVGAWCLLNTYRTRQSRPFSAPRRFAYSLLHFVAYGYEAACFAIASLRYRSLVI